MGGFYAFLKASLTPLVAASCLGMALSGLGLVAAGAWRAVWMPVLAFTLYPLVLPLALLPTVMLANGMRMADARGAKALSAALQIASTAWMIFALSAWAAAVFFPVKALHGWAWWAAVGWAAFGPVAPWAVFARQDRSNFFLTGTALMLQAGCLVAAALVLAAGPLPFWAHAGAVGGVMAALAAAQAALEHGAARKSQP